MSERMLPANEIIDPVSHVPLDERESVDVPRQWIGAPDGFLNRTLSLAAGVAVGFAATGGAVVAGPLPRWGATPAPP